MNDLGGGGGLRGVDAKGCAHAEVLKGRGIRVGVRVLAEEAVGVAACVCRAGRFRIGRARVGVILVHGSEGEVSCLVDGVGVQFVGRGCQRIEGARAR